MLKNIAESASYAHPDQIFRSLLRNGRNAAKVLSSLAVCYFLYKTTKIYLKRRKYNHIPGPPTKG